MKKLVLSAMLTGFIGSSYAGIIYTDVDPDAIVGSSTAVYDANFQANVSEKSIDFDGDQSTDAVISWNDLDFGSYLSSYGINGQYVATDYTSGSGFWHADGLSANTAIGPSSAYSPSNSSALLNNPFYGATFPSDQDLYIGVKFTINSNTHYGWVRIYYDLNNDEVIVKDYAYEDTPDTPINADDTGATVGLNEIEEGNVSIFPNPVADVVTITLNDLSLTTTSVSLVDVSGRMVYTNAGVQNERLQIDLTTFDSGIYFVLVESNEKQKSFKLIKR